MSKKDRETEERVFRMLQHRCGLTGQFQHNPGTEPGEESGKPDFVVDHDGGRLGVEMTCIHIPGKVNGMPLQQHEAEEDEIVENACAKATQCGLPPLKVGVIFTGNPPKKKNRKTDWADTLFEIVRNNCPEPGGIVYLGGMDGGSLPEGFWWVGINRILKWKKHSWNCEDEAGDVETDFSTQLQERINAKAAKLRQYRKHCDKCWLVIAAPGRRPSSFFEFSNEMATRSYRSPFERVFFVAVAVGTVSELRVTEVV
jgi:hypothetical protein